MSIDRRIFAMLCAAALTAAVGCSASPSQGPPADPSTGSKAPISVPTKELPKGVKVGHGKAVIQ